MVRIQALSTTQTAVVAFVQLWRTAADEDCWAGDFTEDNCCHRQWGLTGNPQCWNAQYTYSRCCGLDALPRLPQEDQKWDTTVQQKPVVDESPQQDFDYIIVGSGSAGSVLAARLAAAHGQDGQPNRVLLLEDGPPVQVENHPEPDKLPSDPSFWREPLLVNWSLGGVSSSWTYATGRGLGGTSAVNSMIYTRGSVSEYDQCGWSAELVLAAFRKLEAPMEVPGFAPDPRYHDSHKDGSAGQGASASESASAGYHVSLVSATREELPPLFQALAEAFGGAKIPFRLDPHASDTIHGIGGVWRSMGCGHPRCQPTRVSRLKYAQGRPRQSTYVGVLAPLQQHQGTPALRVVTGARAERVVFNRDKEATGVEVSLAAGGNGEPERRRFFRAAREVVLSAGVFGSPKLLILSGVGEARELERLGIPVVADSPDVGQNLHEHVGASVVVITSVPCPEGYHRTEEGKTTHLGNSREFIGQFYAFMNATSNEPGHPGPVEVEVMILEGCVEGFLSLTFTLILLQSKSAGRIVVQSRNPFTPPHLDYVPLSHSDDLETLANAMRILYTKVFPAASLQGFGLTAFPPMSVVREERLLAAWIRTNLYYYSHPMGTCRIRGAERSGVLDSHFRVLGVHRLRVVDASVYPRSPSGHSDAFARLAGQLAAEFVLQESRQAGAAPKRQAAAAPAGPDAVEDLAWSPKKRGPYAELHSYSGVSMPLLGLGTNGFQGDFATTTVLRYLKLGGRHIDTALLYDNHAEIRAALAASSVDRREIFLVSKLPPTSMGRVEAKAAIDRIVKELGTVDLLLIHWPANFDATAEAPPCARPPGSWRRCRVETWQAMEEAHRGGWARALGVSNFGVRHLQELLDEPERKLHIAVNQVELHPWWQQAELRSFCAQKHIALIAYGSLGSSLLGGAMLKAGSVKLIASRRGRSAAQVLLLWAVQQSIAVIPSSSSQEHIAENLNAFTWKLDDDDIRLLNGVAREDQFRVFLPDPNDAP